MFVTFQSVGLLARGTKFTILFSIKVISLDSCFLNYYRQLKSSSCIYIIFGQREKNILFCLSIGLTSTIINCKNLAYKYFINIFVKKIHNVRWHSNIIYGFCRDQGMYYCGNDCILCNIVVVVNLYTVLTIEIG